MFARRLATISLVSLCLTGCGTYVPEIQEPPLDALSGQQFVDSIIFNVRCEVRDAIVQLYQDYPQGTFMDQWVALITLNLQVEEKSSANPTFNWLPPSPATAIFNLGLTATGSADATRIDKINWVMAVADLRGKRPCGDYRPKGVFLLESDLKLKEWIYDAVTVYKTRLVSFEADTPDGPFKQSVLSHEVKFEVLTSGSVTPGWKLTRLTVNQTGTGIGASRDRTHDLTITLGPGTPKKVPAKDANGNPKKDARGNPIYVFVIEPAILTTNSHLASEIGLSVANNIRNALPATIPTP